MFKFRSESGKHIVTIGREEHMFSSIHDAIIFIKYN